MRLSRVKKERRVPSMSGQINVVVIGVVCVTVEEAVAIVVLLPPSALENKSVTCAILRKHSEDKHSSRTRPRSVPKRTPFQVTHTNLVPHLYRESREQSR